MFKKSFGCIILIVTIVILLTPSFAVSGEVPQVINYSGVLNTLGGVPVSDGNYFITFNIYDAQTGGTPLWTEVWDETTSPVSVTDGSFNAMLGSHNPFPSDFFVDYPTTYLGLSVDQESEMLPRQRITSVGYAFNAGNGIPKGGVIMWSGATDDIPTGWALCDGTNGTPDLRNRFVIGAGDLYSVKAQGGSRTKDLSHAHNGPSHTHTGPNHRHYCNWIIGPYPEGNDYTDTVEDGDPDTPAGSDHQHKIQQYTEYSGTGETGASGNGLTSVAGNPEQDIMPPYFAFCFIMKL